MAAINATPVDTATGQIESEHVHINAKTTHIHGNRQRFSRRYSHYIDSSNNESSYTARANFIGLDAVGEFRDGCSSIPYQNLGVAMSPTQYVNLTAVATELKVHSLGFEIKKITILQENLTTRAQGTTLENTFQSRPSVLMFVDGEHLLDETVGELGLTTHGAYTGNNPNRPRLQIGLQNLPSFATGANNDATVGDFAKIYPSSQTDGGLKEVSWYLRNQVADIAQTGFFIDDLIDPIVLGESEKHSFEWKNPTPRWHKNGRHPYNAVWNSVATTPGVNDRDGYWPPTRASALQTVYQGSMFDHTADNAYDSTANTINGAERGGLGSKGSVIWSGDSVPPYNYIKLPPLWGPTSKMNFTVELWVEYFADIEWRTSGLLPYMNRTWPAATVMTNSISSKPMALSDLRRRFGGAQGNSSLGLEPIEAEEMSNEVEGPAAPKRRRFQDHDTDN